MRHATCIKDVKLTVTGNLGTVAIGEGWRGDLDQVINEVHEPEQRNGSVVVRPARTIRTTVADALGHHLNDSSFTFPSPVQRAPGRRSETPAEPSAETQE